MFIKPLTEDFNEHYRITGLLDIDHQRYILCQERFPSLRGVSFFMKMHLIRWSKKQNQISSLWQAGDDTHVTYIMQALDHDLDVITEKPMVTTAKDAKK